MFNQNQTNMKMKQLPFLSLVFIFLISSCTMEKRLYRPGFYVSHKKSQAEIPTHKQNTGKNEVAATQTDVAVSIIVADADAVRRGARGGIPGDVDFMRVDGRCNHVRRRIGHGQR